MKTKTTFLIIVLLSIFLGNNYAQYPNISTPSAGSMGLINNIQSSINYPTGKANISIPFFTLKSGDIQVPVGISYNTGGIRLEDRFSEAGMGWRLSAGGKITRIVKQRPDALNTSPKPWGKSPYDVYESFFYNISTRYNNHNQIDSEPDVFFFEIPGKSGMFVFDADGNAYTIPHQNISIKYYPGYYGYFYLIDELGNTYKFGDNPTSREETTATFKNDNIKNDGSDTFTYTSTWHLNSITGYKGGYVSFGYSDGEVQNQASYTHILSIYTELDEKTQRYNWKKKEEAAISTTSTPTRILSSITSDNGSILLTKYDSSPYYGNSIGNISYYAGDDFIKSFELGYERFADNRIFLSNITEVSQVNERKELFSFEYNKSRLLPSPTSKDYDSWGYYNFNGISNSNHIPEPDRSEWNGISASMKPSRYANREPNLESAKACMLTKIRNSFGGTTEYVYGLNEAEGKNVGGLRIEEIINCDENNNKSSVKYEYKFDNGASSGCITREAIHSRRELDMGSENPFLGPLYIFSRPVYELYDISGNSVIYGQISEIMPDGSKAIYEYTTPADGESYKNGRGRVWMKSGSEIIDVTAPSSIDYTNAPYFPPESPRFWKQALLKRHRLIDQDGHLVSDTQYEYELDVPARKVIKAYVPYSRPFYGVVNYNLIFEYEWESQPIYLKKVINNATAYTPRKETTYTYNAEWLVPTSVVEKLADNTELKTKIRYPFDIAYSGLADNVDPVVRLYSRGLMWPVETTIFKNNQVIGSELITYKHDPTLNNPDRVLPWKKWSMPLEAPVSDILCAVIFFRDNVLVHDSKYKLDIIYSKYDENGNLLVTEDNIGQISSVVYDNNDIPVAEVVNAAFTGDYSPSVSIRYKDIYSLYIATTGTFTIPVSRQVTFLIKNKPGVTNTYATTYRVLNSSGQAVYTRTEPTLKNEVRFTATLSAGSYGISIETFWTSAIAVDVEVQYASIVPERTNQVYYTSFESEEPNSALRRVDNAKTGRYVCTGTWQVPLHNFMPGSYILTYWKSTNSGSTWQKISQNITVTQNTGYYTLNPGAWIDELRILPEMSRISTYTSLPGIGTSSQTDHSGVTTYTEYDSFGRVKTLRNNERQIVKEYEYHVGLDSN